VQDKAWVHDPDGAPWEVYTVLADAPAKSGLGCSTETCAPDDGRSDTNAAQARGVSSSCC
jgi:hypothetical protein